jgi:hypothetical protein
MTLSSRGLILVALAALAVSPVAGHAQGKTPERVRMSIEETDRRIELAEAVVSTSDDARARGEIALARDLQGRARSTAGSGQLFAAGQLTAQARGHADRAITLVGGLPAPDRVTVQLERTREMLDRSGPRVQECGDDRARAMLRGALEMQGRAEAAEESKRHLGALQLTMGARERGLRALRLCRMEEDVQQVAANALSRTDEVLARVRELLESGARGRAVPEMARDALARATALQDDASREFRDGHCDASLQLTLTARRLAHRAVGRGPLAR